MGTNKLKELRRQRQLSQEEMAKRLGVSRQTIFALERGLWEPSLSLAIKICQLFDTAFDEIFDLEIDSLEDYTGNKLVFKHKKGGEMEMERDLMPWSPFRGMAELHREIDRFFEDAFANPTLSAVSRVPAMNIHEEKDKYIVEAAVPGYQEDEIEIEAGEDYLTVKGSKNEEKEVKGRKYHKREFGFSSFERTVAFPVPINDEKVGAELSDGTLKISVPKKAPAKPKVRKIKVAKK